MDLEPERVRARRFGFSALLLWMSLGFALEAAHALKLSAYLDHPLRRELLVWAHAHGIGLALVVLAYAASGVTPKGARFGPALRGASLLMPLGFALASIGVSEVDPGPSIWLVPIAAVIAIASVLGIARGLPKA